MIVSYRSRNVSLLSQVFDFFNNLNQFYGVLTEFCTIQNNPTMSAGVGCVALCPSFSNLASMLTAVPRHTCSLDYTWIDQNRKQVKLPAPQYIDYVMTWVGGLLSDEATFPTKACEFASGLTLSVSSCSSR